jgi:hypothetical protein
MTTEVGSWMFNEVSEPCSDTEGAGFRCQIRRFVPITGDASDSSLIFCPWRDSS